MINQLLISYIPVKRLINPSVYLLLRQDNSGGINNSGINNSGINSGGINSGGINSGINRNSFFYFDFFSHGD